MVCGLRTALCTLRLLSALCSLRACSLLSALCSYAFDRRFRPARRA